MDEECLKIARTPDDEKTNEYHMKVLLLKYKHENYPIDIVIWALQQYVKMDIEE